MPAGSCHDIAVDLFFSFRSPYSYLALPKTLKLVANYDVTVTCARSTRSRRACPGFSSAPNGNWNTPSPSFDAALKALTDGIEQCDTAMLGFLGVYLD
jgi:hypothetical protein